MRKSSLSQKRGFTLVELLIVIAIIGILASIVFVNVGSVRKKAKRAAALQSFNQIYLAMNMYWEGTLPCCGYFLYGPDNPPPFADPANPNRTYPNWDATYYCPDCGYGLEILWDDDGDGRTGCVFIRIYNPSLTTFIYKNLLCEDCDWGCNYYDYWPK